MYQSIISCFSMQYSSDLHIDLMAFEIVVMNFGENDSHVENHILLFG